MARNTITLDPRSDVEVDHREITVVLGDAVIVTPDHEGGHNVDHPKLGASKVYHGRARIVPLVNSVVYLDDEIPDQPKPKKKAASKKSSAKKRSSKKSTSKSKK